MILFINRYLRNSPKLKQGEEYAKQGDIIKLSPCIRPYGCCHPGTPFFSTAGRTGSSNNNTRSCYAAAATTTTTTTTTARSSRSNFAKLATSSSLFPNATFTNHEALPTLSDAFASFLGVYSSFCRDTQQVELMRYEEYNHLSNHVCLDYVGINLFSYLQMQHSSVSSSGPSPTYSFSISYKSVSLKSHVQSVNHEEHSLNSGIQTRIMNLLNISDDEYSMVCNANATTAFKLLAESYPFDSNRKRLLCVYDHENEAMDAMIESARKRGAEVMSASFTWPGMRIQSARLTKKLIKRRRGSSGLFVFPLQSRMTEARYPYLWMTVAQQNGWQVALDAHVMGPKDMDTLGLSLIQPDFIICSFFKVLGKDPSGFAGLLVKRSSVSALSSSRIAKSIGIVTLIPERSRMSQLNDDDDERSAIECDAPYSVTGLEESIDVPSTSSSSYADICNGSVENVGTSTTQEGIGEQPSSVQIQTEKITTATQEIKNIEVECRGLDHAESLGLSLISRRSRCISNWLVLALMKLKHPHSENGNSQLVRVYGPRVKFDRGNALAFNVFDWKGEKVEPVLVQKLADRNNISLSCGFLQNIIFTDKHEAEKDAVLKRRVSKTVAGKQRKEIIDLGVHVMSLSFNFLTNFEDAYRLWTFVAKFLDADFVEKERWRYVALNQKMVEI